MARENVDPDESEHDNMPSRDAGFHFANRDKLAKPPTGGITPTPEDRAAEESRHAFQLESRSPIPDYPDVPVAKT
jgi:hypothetical protein